MNTPAPTRLFVVEDHGLMREIVTEYLEAVLELEICGSASSADEALVRLGPDDCDLVLIDTSLPGRLSGIDLVGRLSERFPGLPCLMYSGHGERSYVSQALDQGARGYLTKDDPTELGAAIAAVLAGEIYIGRRVRAVRSAT